MMKKLILALTVGILGMSAFAAPHLKVLSFPKWKQKRVIEARNKVVRISNQVHVLKSKNFKVKNKIDKSELSRKQANLKLAIDNLQFTKELTINDYYVIYLSQFTESPDALQQYVAKADKEELAAIIKVFLESKNSPNNGSGKVKNNNFFKHLSN